MNGEQSKGTDPRAQRLRDAAAKAENIAALARLIDAQLGKACGDLLAMAAAAKQLAETLERAADGAEVAL
jgi:hypothetical protein